MTKLDDDRSILGIDPTSRGLAFVWFEGGRLRDWGTRRRDGRELELLIELLDRYKADVLVHEDGDAPRSERRGRTRRLLCAFSTHAGQREITLLAVSRYAVRREWAGRGLTTKQAVAASIGEMFPEIAPLVPRKRKIYRSEEARADIFDALSIVHYAVGTEKL